MEKTNFEHDIVRDAYATCEAFTLLACIPVAYVCIWVCRVEVVCLEISVFFSGRFQKLECNSLVATNTWIKTHSNYPARSDTFALLSGSISNKQPANQPTASSISRALISRCLHCKLFIFQAKQCLRREKSHIEWNSARWTRSEYVHHFNTVSCTLWMPNALFFVWADTHFGKMWTK